MNKLYRSTSDRKISGVIGGLGEYLNVDANLLRLLTLLLFFFTGIVPVVVTYIVAWAILPEDSSPEVTSPKKPSKSAESLKSP